MDLFEQAYMRIDRATDRNRELSGIWNDFLDRAPFGYNLNRMSPTQFVLEVYQHDPMPPTLPVLFGEWLYQLRAALDNLIWAAAAHHSGRIPPPNEQLLQYPIYESEKAWKVNLKRLQAMAPHHIGMLHTMQPFASDGDANFLRWINELARIDRHRHVTEWTARVAVAEPVFLVPSGATPILEWGERTLQQGSCNLARLTFPNPSDGDGVVYNPRIGIDPEIHEWSTSPSWTKVRFSERLRMMETFVRTEIRVYDYDCTGNPSARSPLTDTFAAESDARRDSQFTTELAVPDRPEVRWRPSAPRASTRERLLGLDFPAEGKESHAAPREVQRQPEQDGHLYELD